MVVVVAVMAATAEAAGVAAERAVLETVLYNPVQNGGYVTQSYKLSGIFSPSGTAVSAEGRIIQVSHSTIEGSGLGWRWWGAWRYGDGCGGVGGGDVED